MGEDEGITDKTIRRIKKLPYGRRGEEFVNYFLAPWFSGYWAFPLPKYKGAEIADSLLLWGDVVFLIQIKERKGILSSIGWARKKIIEDNRRISEWVERLKNEESITLRNKYREIVFPRSEIKWYYGLIVLNHHSEPYDPNEFLIANQGEHKVAVQIMSLADLYHLLRYFNTPWDFINYFESRFRLSQKISLRVHQEREVYNLNLEHMYQEMMNDIGKKEADKWNEFMDISVNAVNGDLKFADPGMRRYASSFLIDASIGGRINKAQKDSKGNFIIDNKFIMLTKAVEVLSEMSRLRRSFYGEMFLKVAEKALATGNDEYEIGRSPKRGISYGFVATNKVGIDLEEYLGEIAMSMLTNHNNLEGIFIAAPPDNIFNMYQKISGWFTNNKNILFLSDKIEMLQSTILYINLRRNH